MIGAVMSCENPPDDILVDLHLEGVRDLFGNALIAESGVTTLHLEDGRDDLLRRVLGAWLASGSRGREQAAILSIDQRMVES